MNDAWPENGVNPPGPCPDCKEPPEKVWNGSNDTMIIHKDGCSEIIDFCKDETP